MEEKEKILYKKKIQNLYLVEISRYNRYLK